METIRITMDGPGLSFTARLKDSITARSILDRLPFEGQAQLWGDELYFDIPLNLDLETGASADVAVGDLGYWPAGPAFCIFFGPTPASTGDTPKAYSPVNVFGRIEGDPEALKAIPAGATVRVTAL
jgi:hypothetical protein